MPRTFNFRGISYVPQARTLEFLNLADLIDYSLISPSANLLVRVFHKRCDFISWSIGGNGIYQITISDDMNHFLNGQNYKFKLKYNEAAPEDVEIRKFGNWELTSRKTLGEVKTWCSEENVVEILETVSRELVELFRFQKYYLSVGYNQLDPSLDVFQITNRFEKFRIIGEFQANRPRDELSSETMNFLMTQLEIKSLDILMCVVTPDYLFEGQLNLTSLFTNSLHWIARESLLQMSCKEIEVIEGTDADPELLNDLIITWLAGGLENLELITMNPFNEDEEAVIMDDIDTVRFDPRRHQGEFRGEDVSDGFYIVRESDGMVATITNNFEDGDFKWIIWR